jgi:hypothetical protein
VPGAEAAGQGDAGEGGGRVRLLFLLISLLGGCTNSASVAAGKCCDTPTPGGMVVHLNGAVGAQSSYTR